MRKELVANRANIRSRAILEPRMAARRWLQDVDPSSPVVPRPILSQSILEGLLFQSIRTLHYPWEEGPFESLPGALVITRLRPEPDRLVVDVDPRGVASTLADGALAHVLTAGVPMEVHAPLLRPRATADGIEFHRLGHRGSVLFRGVSLDDVLAVHAGRCERDLATTPGVGEDTPQHGNAMDEIDYVWRTSPRAPTTAELQNVELYLTRRPDRQAALWVTSSVVRRLGMLTRLGATSIDTWQETLHGRATVKVEAWYDDMEQSTRDRLLRDLCSPHLAPQWTSERQARHGGGADRYHYFNVAGTIHRVQLRLLHE